MLLFFVVVFLLVLKKTWSVKQYWRHSLSPVQNVGKGFSAQTKIGRRIFTPLSPEEDGAVSSRNVAIYNSSDHIVRQTIIHLYTGSTVPGYISHLSCVVVNITFSQLNQQEVQTRLSSAPWIVSEVYNIEESLHQIWEILRHYHVFSIIQIPNSVTVAS